jgi:hypothetical protein
MLCCALLFSARAVLCCCQVGHLEHLVKLYSRGDVPRCDWLDMLAFKVTVISIGSGSSMCCVTQVLAATFTRWWQNAALTDVHLVACCL